MNIKVNGKEFKIEENTNIKQLIIKLEFDLSKIAVELNGEIATKSQHENIILKNNDVLEIVTFVGGG